MSTGGSRELRYRWIYTAFAILSLVVFATGVWLSFFYRPTAAAAWEDIFELQSSWTWSSATQTVHRWTTVVWLVVLVPLTIVELVRQNVRGTVLALVAHLASIGVAFLGLLLPWDQLALQAVTVGTNMEGFAPVLSGDGVRFVLLDGKEVSMSSIRRYFVVHVVLGTLILVATQFARRGRRQLMRS